MVSAGRLAGPGHFLVCPSRFRVVAMQRFLLCLLSFTLLAAGVAAQAAVVIGGTRVIYPGGDREVSVQLTNDGENPALVQVWIDAGDADAAPEQSDVPFIVLPPISRVEAGSGQVLRISFTGGKMPPEDRESVYWLNVLDIPPAPKAEEGIPQNFLQLAVRSRIKLFYRPKGLSGKANDAPEKLQWYLSRSGGQAVLKAKNPTPYHVTVSRLEILRGESALVPVPVDEGMIAPGGSLEFPLPANAPAAIGQVRMTTINDFGGRVARDVPVGR